MRSTDSPTPPATRARAARFRQILGGYLSARRADLFGRPGSPRPARDLVDLLDVGPTSSPPPQPASWKNADAALARAFFAGAIIGVAVCAHRLWLGDAAGAGASLGTAFTSAGFALAPAFRCWRKRTRASGTGREFLRRPAAWWPSTQPPDDTPDRPT